MTAKKTPGRERARFLRDLYNNLRARAMDADEQMCSQEGRRNRALLRAAAIERELNGGERCAEEETP